MQPERHGLLVELDEEEEELNRGVERSRQVVRVRKGCNCCGAACLVSLVMLVISFEVGPFPSGATDAPSQAPSLSRAVDQSPKASTKPPALLGKGKGKGKGTQYFDPPSKVPSGVRHNITGVKPILFIHFHKAGGTSVCKTMEKVMTMTDVDRTQLKREKNCNTMWSGPYAKITTSFFQQRCRSLTPFTTDEHNKPFNRNNFIALEILFMEAMPCPGFRSFAVMRDPVQRLVSHM
eukprot:1378754-Rhodomonas_salina.4